MRKKVFDPSLLGEEQGLVIHVLWCLENDAEKKAGKKIEIGKLRMIEGGDCGE